ncbi:isoprenylcysteine carboxyl methyltransferase family protein [Humibacter sp.]|uniref:isoprenylcysteine carboxyl methyltransferase family protein n=1 Tax=Humibacter sp. TaxID=1940291 RepID=UPI003F81E1D3
MTWYAVLVLLVGLERLAELVVSARNARWSLAHGGREYARGQLPPMIALHVALLVGCLLEAWLAGAFLPWLGYPMLVLLVVANALRWWCIGTLGRQWSVRVIVIPGAGAVRGGPYRWLRHPNYLAVGLDGIALPLVYAGWITAVAFTILNAVLLWGFRIPAEERALAQLHAHAVPDGA